MRQLFVVGTVLVAALANLSYAEQAGTMKCKADGLHLCCTTCEVVIDEVLTKTPGVTGVKVDRKAKDQVTFEAKDEKTAKDAMAALVKGGLCCTITAGANVIKAETPAVNVKGDELTIKDVHVCCGACTKAIRALFKDATITVTGTGAQKDVTIAGKNLDGQAVLSTLQKAGFTGTVQAKK